MLERAREAGVTEMVTIGTDRETNPAAVALAEGQVGVYATVGIHPHDAADATEADFHAMERLARDSVKVVALGEMGLDFFRNLSPRDVQERVLRHQLGRLPAHTQEAARLVAGNEDRILKVIEPLLTRKLTGLRIRTHGDYHLEQVLYTGKDFVIIDFYGPNEQPLADRRRKHWALRDVAGMIRSFHFAALSSLLDGAVVREEDRQLIAPSLPRLNGFDHPLEVFRR